MTNIIIAERQRNNSQVNSKNPVKILKINKHHRWLLRYKVIISQSPSPVFVGLQHAHLQIDQFLPETIQGHLAVLKILLKKFLVLPNAGLESQHEIIPLPFLFDIYSSITFTKSLRNQKKYHLQSN